MRIKSRVVLIGFLFVLFVSFVGMGVCFGEGPKSYGSFDTEGPVRSTALVDAENAYTGSDSGKVFALDRIKGRVKWRFQADGAVSSDLASDGTLLFFSTKKGTVYALKCADGKDVWKFETKAKTYYPGGWDYFVSSPVITGKQIVVGSGDGFVYALDKQSGKMKWKYHAKSMVRSTPAVDKQNKMMVIGTMNGELLALSIKKGKLKWKFKAKGNKYFPKGEFLFKPLIHGDTVYAGSRDAAFYAVNLKDGKLRWKVEEKKGYWYTRAAAHGSVIYAASSDGHYIQALDTADGKEKWKFLTEGLVFTTPLVHNGVVYTGSHDRRVYAVDAETGKFLWRFKAGGKVLGSPVISGKVLMAGSDDGRFFAVELPSAKPSEPLNAVYFDPAMDKKAKQVKSGYPRILSDYFRDHGYRLLDAGNLEAFMKARITDKKPSIIVLASQVYPYEIFASQEKKPALIRQYMDAGGKLAGIGAPPLRFAIKKNEEKVMIPGKEVVKALDIDPAFYNSGFWFYDTYYARSTMFASGMGYPNWFISGFGVPAKAVTKVYATDEHGRAVAWLKTFGGPEGTGFMMLWTNNRFPQKMDFLRKVAEYVKKEDNE